MKALLSPEKKKQTQSCGISKYAKIGALLLCALGTCNVTAAHANGPKVYTNQDYVESVTKQSKLDLGKPKAVFQHVLNSLPETVRVYPTEGYYYFYFYQDGVKYAGNIRLDIEERAKGNLLFNFFKATNDWSYDKSNHFTRFGKKDDVIIKKVKNLTYSVTSDKKTVTFELDDMSSVKIPEGTIRKEETYIGPIFDESGIRFLLVFNPDIKGFHYILDESQKGADELLPTKVSPNIMIGRRTGFAYYQDPKVNRKILIAVHDRNSSVNNYFDGPFDQLPDSFLKGDDLKNAIIAVAPGLKGKIDRYGNFDGDSQRFLISPYIYYTQETDLKFIDDCVKGKQFPDHNQCYVVPDQTPIEEIDSKAPDLKNNSQKAPLIPEDKT